jgi:CheY-like chemotaxis protein
VATPGGSIVVVDDEPTILELMSAVLTNEGYTVLGLRHPAQATDITFQYRPRLFLLDLMLPGMNGIELARLLRKSDFADTPMIALSASAGLLQVAAASCLFQALVRKPFELDQLLKTVERLAV